MVSNSLVVSLVAVFYWLLVAAATGSLMTGMAVWIFKRRQPQAGWLVIILALFGAMFLAAAIIVDQCVLPYITGELSLITQR